uniref:Uncharacterized protein n=1 Tax=Cacopsylla melanoneura TaxID=428564 RepID=A0A8D8UFP6_9HEMI
MRCMVGFLIPKVFLIPSLHDMTSILVEMVTKILLKKKRNGKCTINHVSKRFALPKPLSHAFLTIPLEKNAWEMNVSGCGHLVNEVLDPPSQLAALLSGYV